MKIVGLFLVFPAIAALRLDECSSYPLGMESGEITDSQLTASSSFDKQSVGPQNARIRTEQASGAWCPKLQISGNSYEFLQINLEKTHVITAIETQGRFGNGTGKEFATEYMIDYLRPGSKWIRYKNRTGHNFMTGNFDTFTAVFRTLDPPIVASRIRIVPHSKTTRTICLRAEIHGCLQRDGLLYYSTLPEGSRIGEFDFRDHLFEENELTTETGTKRGLGLLTDGYVANGSPFDVGHPNGSWIGWNKHHIQGAVVLLFEFDQLRNFSEILFAAYGHRMENIDVIFSQDGSNFPLSSQISSLDRLAANSTEKRYDLRIPLHKRMARKVRVTIKFPGDWLFLTELHFSSVFANQTDTNDTLLVEEKNLGGHQRLWSILGLCLLFLLFVTCLLCIFCCRKRQKPEKSLFDVDDRDVKKSLVTIHHGGKFATQLQPYDFINFYGTEKTTSTSVSTKSTSSGEKISPPTINDIHFPPPPSWTPEDRIYAEPCTVTTNTLPLPPKKAVEFKGTMTAHRVRHTQSAKDDSLHYATANLLASPSPTSRVEKISFNSIRFRPNPLGHGFSTVLTECIVSGKGHAVYKKAKDPKSSQARKALLDEIRTMSVCSHPNVVQLLATDDNGGLLLEYVPNKDVRTFLKVKDGNELELCQLLSICADVCAGMLYLESRGLVHGHLTPAHVLLDANLNAKITSARGPAHAALLRYSAPESILSAHFSCYSESWAFSVTSWEILNQCQEVPYAEMSNEDLVRNAEMITSRDPRAQFLVIPEFISHGLRNILHRCLDADPRRRPTFSSIYAVISRFHVA